MHKSLNYYFAALTILQRLHQDFGSRGNIQQKITQQSLLKSF